MWKSKYFDILMNNYSFIIVFVCIVIATIYISISLVERYASTFLSTICAEDQKPSVKILPSRLSINIYNIKFSRIFLQDINRLLHFNCQFSEFSVQQVSICLIPKIHIEVSYILFRGYSSHPHMWSIAKLTKALQDMRSSALNSMTSFICTELRSTGYYFQKLLCNLLHCIDIIIATASINIHNVDAGFCAKKIGVAEDTLIVVKIEHILAKPNAFFETMFTEMFQMQAAIENVSIGCVLFDSETPILPPMLHPVSVKACLTLPKILSQMITKRPTAFKYCALDIEADKMTVDMCETNVTNLINFSLSIILYRQWYVFVMELMEQTYVKNSQFDSTRVEDNYLAQYVAVYTSYHNCAVRKEQAQLLDRLAEMEGEMSTSSIKVGRGLALGWLEKNRLFKEKFQVDWSSNNMQDFSNAMLMLFDKALFGEKEMRHIKVHISVNVVDLLLSTPRTQQQQEEQSAIGHDVGDNHAVTLSLHGIKMNIIDPIVPPAFEFDQIRNISMAFQRIVLTAGNPVTNESMDIMPKMIFDRYRLVNQFPVNSPNPVSSQDSSLSEMVCIQIKEDEQKKTMEVDVVLRNGMFLCDILNLVETVEYALSVVTEATSAVSFWLNTVDIPHKYVPSSFPSSAFDGKHLNVAINLQQCGVAIKDTSHKSADILLSTGNIELLLNSRSKEESILAKLYDVKGYLCSQRDDPNWRGMGHRPELLIASYYENQHFSHENKLPFRWDFNYSLKCVRDIPPDVFVESDLNYRPILSEGDPLPNILLRNIKFISNPLWVNIYPQQSKLLITWFKRTMQKLPTTLNRLGLNVQLMKAMGEQVNMKVNTVVYLSYIEKLLKKYAVGAESLVPTGQLREMLRSILREIHLIASEMEEQMNDLVDLFDCDGEEAVTDRKILLSALTSFLRSDWNDRGVLSLKLNEYRGAKPPDFVMESFTDGRALHQLWHVIQEETGVSRQSRTLGQLSPATFQIMLVKICVDHSLAQSVWDNIIRVNLKSKAMQIYPWVLSDEQKVFGRTSIELLLKTMMKRARQIEIDEHDEVLNFNMMQGLSNSDMNDIDSSYTYVDIDIGHVTYNIIDSLLGPHTPKFQWNITNTRFSGSSSFLGSSVDMSMGATYGLTARFFGDIVLEGNFFNSHISAHEPFVEPFALSVAIVKTVKDSYLSFEIKDSGKLAVDISASFLQTFASFIASINAMLSQKVDYAIIGEKDRHYGNDAGLSDSRALLEIGSSPSLIIYNDSGVDIDLSLSAAIVSTDFSFTEAIDFRDLEVKIKNNEITPISISWDKYSSSTSHVMFPTVQFLSTISQEVAYHTPAIPLHLCSYSQIFLTRNDATTAAVFSSFVPGVIFEMQSKSDTTVLKHLHHGVILSTRSNLRIKNSTGRKIKMRSHYRTDSSKEETYEFDLDYRSTSAIPVNIIDSDTMEISILLEDATQWSHKIDLFAAITNKVRKLPCDNCLLYIETSVLKSNSNREMIDYLVEVVNGLQVLNALPYMIQVKCSEEMDVLDTPKAVDKIINIHPGKLKLLKIGYYESTNVNLSFRIITDDLNYDMSYSSEMWSTPVYVSKYFAKGARNITFGSLEFPNPSTRPNSLSSVAVTVRTIKDPSKEYSDDAVSHTSAPIIEFYADAWIQNNSSYDLSYKFSGDTIGSSIVVSDSQRGRDHLNYPDKHELPSLSIGPLICPLASKSFIFKINKTRIDNLTSLSLQRFKNLKMDVPMLSDKESSWSRKVDISQNMCTELQCGRVVFGIKVISATGRFSRTNIVVITPHFLIENLTSFHLDILPVETYKRIRVSSISSQSEDVKEMAARTPTDQTEWDIDDNTDAFQKLEDYKDILETFQGGVNDENSTAASSIQHLSLSNNQPEDYHMQLAEKILELKSLSSEKSIHHLDRLQSSSKFISYDATEEDNDPMNTSDIETRDPAHRDDVFLNNADRHGVLSLKPFESCAFYSFIESKQSLLRLMHSKFRAISVRLQSGKRSPKTNLEIKLFSASDLAKTDIIGSSDAMVVVSWLGEIVHKTKIVIDSLFPVWNETVSIPFHVNPKDCELLVEVFGCDLGMPVQFHGQVRFGYQDIMQNDGKVKDYTLVRHYGADEIKERWVKGSVKIGLSCGTSSDSFYWTAPFDISNPITESISCKGNSGKRILIDIAIEKVESLVVVSLKDHSFTSLPPYKVENRTPDLTLRFRQQYTTLDSNPRHVLLPTEYTYFAWDNDSLPKAIEIVAVDKHGTQSPTALYKFDVIGKSLSNLNVSALDNVRSHLNVFVKVEGRTRVLVVTSPSENRVVLRNKKNSYLSEFKIGYIMKSRISLCFSGLEISLINEIPQEVVSIVIEEVRVFADFHTSEWVFSIHHFQLDNMQDVAKFPVILSPIDSGHNSHLNEDFNGKDLIPFFKMTLDIDTENLLHSADAVIINKMDIKLYELCLIVDFDFVVKLVASMITPNVLAAYRTIRDILFLENVNFMLETKKLLICAFSHPTDSKSFAAQVVFFKQLNVHTVSLKILLSVAVDDSVDIDPRSIGSEVEYSTIQSLLSLSRGLTTINPSFRFNGFLIRNIFGTVGGISYTLASVYAAQAAAQLFTILGSAEIFGDPVGAMKTLGTSVRVFVKKTKTGNASGVKSLVQGVVDVSFGTAGKVTNSLGKTIAGVQGTSYVKDMERNEPAHVGEGVLQGGEVLVRSIAKGVYNVGHLPMEGIRKKSVKKTFRGVFNGITGLAVSPVIGALGAVTKVCQGINSTPHMLDDKPNGRCRPPRPLFIDPQLKLLKSSKLFSEFSIRICGFDLLVSDVHSPSLRDLKIVISLQYGDSNFSTSPLPFEESHRCDLSDSSCEFRFKMNTEKQSYKAQPLLLKCCLMSRPTSILPYRKVTIAKCFFHPLTLADFSTQDRDDVFSVDIDDENSIWKHNKDHITSLVNNFSSLYVRDIQLRNCINDNDLHDSLEETLDTVQDTVQDSYHTSAKAAVRRASSVVSDISTLSLNAGMNCNYLTSRNQNSDRMVSFRMKKMKYLLYTSSKLVSESSDYKKYAAELSRASFPVTDTETVALDMISKFGEIDGKLNELFYSMPNMHLQESVVNGPTEVIKVPVCRLYITGSFQ